MKKWALFETKRGNKYLFNRDLKFTHPVHPVFYYLLEMESRGERVQEWIDRIGEKIKIEPYGEFSKEEIEYYYRKYNVLKKNGYFSEVLGHKLEETSINADLVRKTLANTGQVTFEVTDRCNLDCAYCGYGKFYTDYDKRENKELDLNTAKTLLEYLAELWNSPLNRSLDKNIYMGFYGGEPLLNMTFIEEMVRYAGNLKLTRNHFTFSITTNGLLLDKYMDFLYEHDFKIMISLDGNEFNNSYRMFKNGKGIFGKVMENVEALRNKYDNYFKRRVDFNAVLHNRNSVSDIHGFFREEFGKMPSIGALNTMGIAEKYKKEFMQTYSNITESLYEAEDYSKIEKDLFGELPTIKDLMVYLYRFSPFHFDTYTELISDTNITGRIPTGTCMPFSKRVFLTVNGKILPCERIGQQYALGKVLEGHVDLDFDRVADMYNEMFKTLCGTCEACHILEICRQCAFYLGGKETETECNQCIGEKGFSNYLSSIMEKFEEDGSKISQILDSKGKGKE